MKPKYNYSISIIFDYGMSSIDRKATTLKQAKKKINWIKKSIKTFM